MGLRAFLRGDDIQLQIDRAESRALTRDNVPAAMLPYSRTALLNVGTSNALAVCDAYACVRCLADTVASLPPKIYRKTPAGRVQVGDDQRLAALLRIPSPGSTSADLFGLMMVYLNLYGNAYVGKFRGPDGEVAQLALIHPDRVVPETRGSTLVYRIDGDDSYGVRDLVHVKGMPDPANGGLLGLSPVAQCRLALTLSANLQESAQQFFENGSRPSGILSVDGASEEGLSRWREAWRNQQSLQAGKMHSIAVVEGEGTSFTALGFNASDSEFLGQRELSAREVCRIFRVPPSFIAADSGGSLTYSTVLQENLYFATHSLRPWLVRIERAFSNDPELMPGNSYLEFSLDSLLRADPAERASLYTAALNPQTGWMTRSEIRELENLAPEQGGGNGQPQPA
jgi:HK97 family phage portal protein